MLRDIQLVKKLHRICEARTVEEYDRLRGQLVEEPEYRFIDKDGLLLSLVLSVLKEKELQFKVAGLL